MQSQLEAALLGHTSNVNTTTTTTTATTSTATNIDDDENNYQDEDGEDVGDFIDEDVEGNNGQRIGKPATSNTSLPRTVTLQMLLGADILQPGNGTMTIEYLGQKFVGDLLEDGKIRSQETDIVFASPSAWAIACKRFINPDKKSGCGWASVRYKGRKLDAYKNIWYKKRKEQQNLEREVIETNIEMESVVQKNIQQQAVPYHRVVVKHNTIANRTVTHDANTLIECVPFSSLGKIQPFLVSLSTNAVLLMDFHCHLTKSEVSGYLAGHWDVNTHNLQITRAFPCRCTRSDRENAQHIEAEICKTIEKEKLILVGWYHSHPYTAAAPTLRDVDAQLDYQIRMKGPTDNNYTPCIGIIISPYNIDNSQLESSIIAYWVIPPPEMKPNEYGRPMLMSYSVIQDSLITITIKDDMQKCVDYYKKESDFINFNECYIANTLYVDKLKNSLISKFPRDENETTIWRYIRDILGFPIEENDNLLSIPLVNTTTISSSSCTPTTTTTTTSTAATTSQLLPNLNTNLLLPSDISNLLFNSGKFPSASSLLGLPDPMAHSTLAANNMFLSTNLFKMQELLKPLSQSSPIMKKPDKHTATIKIPPTNDMKINKQQDFTTELLNLKNKLDFLSTDFNLSNNSSCSSNNNNNSNKQEFSIPDLAKLSDYNLNLSKTNSLLLLDSGEKPAKILKSDCSTLDLSFNKTNIDDNHYEHHNKTFNLSGDDNKPLNLVANDFIGGSSSGQEK